MSKPKVRNLVGEVRRNQGLTQEMVASRCRVSVRTIHAMEKGERTTAWTRRRVLKVLGLDYAEDKGWMFPGPEMAIAIVEVSHDKVTAMLNVSEPKELALFGRRVLETLLQDGRVQRPLVYGEDGE